MFFEVQLRSPSTVPLSIRILSQQEGGMTHQSLHQGWKCSTRQKTPAHFQVELPSLGPLKLSAIIMQVFINFDWLLEGIAVCFLCNWVGWFYKKAKIVDCVFFASDWGVLKFKMHRGGRWVSAVNTPQMQNWWREWRILHPGKADFIFSHPSISFVEFLLF